MAAMGADRRLAVFYGWWDARFLILPVAQITLTWLLALAHERTEIEALLIAGIVLNLASLGRSNISIFARNRSKLRPDLTLPRAHIVLPIGISFFSFQLISYLVDRMRGQAPLYAISAVCAVRAAVSASHCRPDRAP